MVWLPDLLYSMMLSLPKEQDVAAGQTLAFEVDVLNVP
jgi:hypothetical protein